MNNPNSISRICLDPETRAVVDLIQAKTSTASPSAAIALLVKRYGNHLLESWEVTSTQAPERVQPPVAAIAPPVDANEKWTQWQL